MPVIKIIMDLKSSKFLKLFKVNYSLLVDCETKYVNHEQKIELKLSFYRLNMRGQEFMVHTFLLLKFLRILIRSYY